MIIDAFPFSNELDVLEIRLHELNDVVDAFIVVESGETFGGQRKPFILSEAIRRGRFAKFSEKLLVHRVEKLEPACTDRVTGRLREADQRNWLGEFIRRHNPRMDDVVIFSDCDEIPSADAVREAIPLLSSGPWRFAQRSYYYTVNKLVDYGHDFASRARIGTWQQVLQCGSMYEFRMCQKNTCPAIDNGGWHFSYFNNGNGILDVNRKVDTLSPFLSEYKLFGNAQLVRDIVDGCDLHHRRCEMPETFTHCASDDPSLPKHFLENRDRFAHFTEEWYRETYKELLRG